jgi:hypothetical protein
MIDQVEKFRRNAEECVQLAEQARSAEHKASLLRMAQEWNQMAEDAASTIRHEQE